MREEAGVLQHLETILSLASRCNIVGNRGNCTISLGLCRGMEEKEQERSGRGKVEAVWGAPFGPLYRLNLAESWECWSL